ncbi:hypothetical protein ACHAWF_018985 [Thalassiosira exigua]
MHETANPATAISVDDYNIVTDGDESNHAIPSQSRADEGNHTGVSCGRAKEFTLAVCVSFLLGGVLGGLVGWIIADRTKSTSEDVNAQKLIEIEQILEELTLSKEDDTKTAATVMNGSVQDEEISTQPTTLPSPYMNKAELKTFLSSISPDDGAALGDSESPQFLAFSWIWDEIEGGKNFEEIQLMQRYVLATLFYTTTGEGWTNVSDF